MFSEIPGHAAHIFEFDQPLLYLSHGIAAVAQAVGTGLCLCRHQDFCRHAADGAVRNQAVLVLECLDRFLQAAAEEAVHRPVIITQFFQLLLIRFQNFRLIAVGKRFALGLFGIEHFSGLGADGAVRRKPIGLLECFYRFLGIDAVFACHILQKAQFHQAALQFAYVRTFIAQRNAVLCCLVGHQQLIFVLGQNAIHFEPVFAFKQFHCLGSRLSIGGGRFICLHIAQLHQPPVNAGNDLGIFCANGIAALLLFCRAVAESRQRLLHICRLPAAAGRRACHLLQSALFCLRRLRRGFFLHGNSHHCQCHHRNCQQQGHTPGKAHPKRLVLSEQTVPCSFM